jgi:lipoate-protein ligase A
VTGGLRVVSIGECAPAEGLALDEAVVREDPVRPLLVLWRCSPAVVVGRFQRVDWEIDPDACADRGVRVWRRFTGGGAVYLDPGTLCAGLVLPSSHPDAGAGVPDLYAPMLTAMAAACRRLGVEATRDERTVRVNGRKVTGVAAHRGARATLVHATLLVSADLSALRGCLAGPRGGDLEGLPRPAPSRPDHVTLVGGTVAAAEAALIEELAGRGASVCPPSPAEFERAAALRRDRYDDPAWHAGPWAAVTPAAVAAVLGRTPAGADLDLR